MSLSSYVKTLWVNDVSPDIDAAHLLKVEQGIYDVTEEVKLLADPGDLKMVGYVVTAGAEPAGWLLCDGRSVLRATYSDLFSAIGTTYGSADGTHFNLPDFRGRSPLGVGTGSGLTARALAASGGEETHLLTPGETALRDHTHYAQMGTGASAVDLSDRAARHAGGADSAVFTNVVAGVAGGALNASQAHNTMHPWLAINFLIKT